MTANSLKMNGETETSAGADQLTGWLSNLNRHGDTLLDAIREGRVKVTTTAGFSELAGRLRGFAQAYADEAFKTSELTSQKVILTNTIFYLLKSCEGIAGNADKIAELFALLPLGQGLDAKAILPLLMDGKKRDTIFNTVKLLGSAFDASWLTKIEVNALAPILQEAGIEFTAYMQLAEVLRQQLPSETQTPALQNGEAAN